jgi:trk system potassium uptake protein TrkA
MRVAIAGAGAVGRSIARELLENGHEVLLIDQSPRAIKVDSVPRAEWLLADACEISSLDDAGLDRCDVVVAATGDDKVNLVVALLAKTEYGVPRVVARVNHPGNEWLYNESWGVDVAVSTPRLLSALVEEAVSVGDLVKLMTFGHSEASLVELTMPADAPLAGRQVGAIQWPADAALVAILREGRVLVPQPEDPLQGGDELFFVTTEDVEADLERLFDAKLRSPRDRAADLSGGPIALSGPLRREGCSWRDAAPPGRAAPHPALSAAALNEATACG